MASKKSKLSKDETMFIKCLMAPFRILGKAKDLYVQSLTDCSGKMSYGGSTTGPFNNNNMPRSYSASSSVSTRSDEDFKELLRAASQRGLVEKLQLEIQRQRQDEKLPRSFTVGIGRIDEDKPYEGEDDGKGGGEFLYPRSKSHAVPRKNSYAI